MLKAEYAINNHLTPFISMQNQHSATYREEEREMMPTLRYFGVGCIPWSPLAGGRESRGAKHPRADRQSSRVLWATTKPLLVVFLE